VKTALQKQINARTGTRVREDWCEGVCTQLAIMLGANGRHSNVERKNETGRGRSRTAANGERKQAGVRARPPLPAPSTLGLLLPGCGSRPTISPTGTAHGRRPASLPAQKG
jgi:hypothetical protein